MQDLNINRTIEDALRQEVERLRALTDKLFSDECLNSYIGLQNSSGNVWIPEAKQISEEDFEWQQTLLGTMDNTLAQFLVNALLVYDEYKKSATHIEGK